MDLQRLTKKLGVSFLLGLSGVVGTYIVQWLSTLDLGPTWTPLLAAGLPVLVNAVREWWTAKVLPTDDSTNPPVVLSLLPWLFVLVLASAPVYAEAPRAVINGPVTAIPGELIVLDAGQSEGEPTHYAWRVTPEIKGRKQITPVENGKRLQMASFPGTYLLTLVVSNKDGNDILQWQVNIPGTPPCPAPDPQPVNPQPGPTPTPDPVQPIPTPTPTPPDPVPTPVQPGRFGVGEQVRKAVLGVSSATRPAEVAKLRSRLTELRAQGAAGTLSAQGFLDAIVAELKALPDTWQVVKSLAAMGIRLLVTGGQLKTVQDFIDLAGEILDALNGL